MSCFYGYRDRPRSHCFTHFVVREDAQLLYGFNKKSERELFREVIKANGVGPRVGLAILSAMTASQFVRSVETEDVLTALVFQRCGDKTR